MLSRAPDKFLFHLRRRQIFQAGHTLRDPRSHLRRCLKDQVQTLKMKLDEARARQNVLIARAKMAEAATNVATSISAATTESAFAKLDKLEKKIVQQEATAEAFTELHGNTVEQASVADEFEQLQHKDAVDSELERLKTELGMA